MKTGHSIRLHSSIIISLMMWYLAAGLPASWAQAGVSARAEDWAPSWQLPPAERPANIVEAPITARGEMPVGRFFPPIICGACHTEIFQQWRGSTHAYSWYDPVLVALYQKGLREANGEEERKVMDSCVRCHSPVGYTSGDFSTPSSSPASEASRENIFCDFCHSVKASTGIGNAPFIVEPGDGSKMDFGVKRGPFKDCPNTVHKTEFSELHTRSEFCGSCHDVSHAGNKLAVEQTYAEWRNGPYNTGDPKTSVHCQDCHMRQRPGVPSTGATERPDNPGLAAQKNVGGIERPHIWTHYYVGGTSLILGPASQEAERAKMAEERLKNAASVQIEAPGSIKPGELARIKLIVKNIGAGHYLPTGLTEVRQMWLDLAVTDSSGKELYHSGTLDDKGDVDNDAVVYHTVFGNDKGEPTYKIWEATRVISDHRIPPKGQHPERYAFLVPQDAQLPITIKATLRYRSAPPWLLAELLGDKAPVLPIVDMAVAETTVAETRVSQR